ncbi:unnamed protein product [Acanthoscelides obtectus]|uniref:Uncharacterized protein n=1 Tax=Acanthoscelides obtectus TaxID=200917 RepID=A0A9P0K6L9_ACAOB|nr:unnamed protein product [Acanthoscelides obtectus]CAK1673457.1 hypothetical protein AOBTE_LOCUS29344 [Acanthoscelides obtectus]
MYDKIVEIPRRSLFQRSIMISTMHMSIRVLVVSDSRSSGEAQDVAGEKLIEALHKMFPHAVLARSTVPDEKAQIKTYLKKYAEQNMDLGLSTILLIVRHCFVYVSANLTLLVGYTRTSTGIKFCIPRF